DRNRSFGHEVGVADVHAVELRPVERPAVDEAPALAVARELAVKARDGPVALTAVIAARVPSGAGPACSPAAFGLTPEVMRTMWVSKRANDPCKTQMHYARKGVVTEEMAYIAVRERV